MAKTGISNALSKRIGAAKDGLDPIGRAYDEMFGIKSDGGEKIVELELAEVKPHPLDPFKPYPEDRLKELADSIAKVGLLDPINVRPDGNGGYEVLAGKNRSNAVRLNGDKKIKAIIRDVDDDTAVLIITDSNLRHREKLLPSEKAFAYKLQLDAIKNQGKRSDLGALETSVQFEQKLSRNIVAGLNNIKDSEVQRYVRLTYLIPELLDLIDSEEIPLMAGVDLSHINEGAQLEVYRYFFESTNGDKLNLKISAVIKQAYSVEKTPISETAIEKLLNKRQGEKKAKPFTINRNKFKDYSNRLPGDKELAELFMEFLHERFG